MSWLLLTSGRGPGECQLAVAGLVETLCAEAREAGIEAEVLDVQDGSHGPLSALAALRGAGADDLARSWEGTVRWTCPSSLRPGWPRKNWYVGVSRLAPPPPSLPLREADLRVEALRASGPGGQHVNTTESAVRLTHVPTGVSVLAREERSQHRNRALATARLAAALAERGRRSEAAAERDRRSRHDALERGNEARAYSGPRFVRVR